MRALSLAWGPPVAHAPSTKGKARGSSSSPFLSSPARTHNADLLSAEDSPETSSLPEYFSTPTESYLIAGCSNSSIRRFDVPNSGSLAGVWRSVHRMTVDQLKGEQTVIWAVVVLKDGTLVSGDSMGNIKFWDSSMGTQLQSFKTHKADVLCIAIGSVRPLFRSPLFQTNPNLSATTFRTAPRSSPQESTKRPLNSDLSAFRPTNPIRPPSQPVGSPPRDVAFTHTTSEPWSFRLPTSSLSPLPHLTPKNSLPPSKFQS